MFRARAGSARWEWRAIGASANVDEGRGFARVPRTRRRSRRTTRSRTPERDAGTRRARDERPDGRVAGLSPGAGATSATPRTCATRVGGGAPSRPRSARRRARGRRAPGDAASRAAKNAASSGVVDLTWPMGRRRETNCWTRGAASASTPSLSGGTTLYAPAASAPNAASSAATTRARTPGQDKGDSTSLQRECSARARSGKSIHASRPFREMIDRPKISRNEWKTAEI